jgi:hypothetical protein
MELTGNCVLWLALVLTIMNIWIPVRLLVILTRYNTQVTTAGLYMPIFKKNYAFYVRNICFSYDSWSKQQVHSQISGLKGRIETDSQQNLCLSVRKRNYPFTIFKVRLYIAVLSYKHTFLKWIRVLVPASLVIGLCVDKIQLNKPLSIKL